MKIKIDSNSPLPRKYWTEEQCRAPRGEDMGRQDAAETGFVAVQTRWLYSEWRRQYTPNFWRTIIRKDSSIPEFLEKYDMRRRDGFIPPPVPMSVAGKAQAPKPDMRVQEVRKGIFEFKYSHEVTYREIDRAKFFNSPIDSERLEILADGAEMFLENVAATGESVTGLTGLANLPDVATVTLSGAAWAGATFAQVLADLQAMYFSVENGSGQTAKCTHILIPLASAQVLSQKFSTQDRTVLEVFRNAMRESLGDRAPVITAWNKLNTAGAGSTKRVVAYDANHRNGPRMLLSRELSAFGPPRLISGGYEQDMTLVTGGVIAPAATSVTYGDGI